jgi:hypothetical protein
MRLPEDLAQHPLELGGRNHVQLAEEREHDAPVIIPAVDRKVGGDGRILVGPRLTRR